MGERLNIRNKQNLSEDISDIGIDYTVIQDMTLLCKRNLRNLIVQGLFIRHHMMRFPPILAGKRNWMFGLHRPSKMRLMTFRLEVSFCFSVLYQNVLRLNHQIEAKSALKFHRGALELRRAS